MTAKEDYYWHKSRGICVTCRIRDARPGKILCKECNDKRHEGYIAKYKDKRIEKYHELKDAGICPRCGEAKPEPGLTYCKECRAKRRRRVRNTDDF